jgi:hypothetical protein
MLDHAADLRSTVSDAARTLRGLSAEAAARPLAPGKWSPKQIIGHLIDSASNNHQRFVRAQFRDDLVFDGYAQDDWVRVQRYESADWPTLLDLWQAFNLHIAAVMDAVPDDVRLRPRQVHNLHRLAWETVPPEEPASLQYFMRDYVNHLRHHLRQIDPRLAAAPVLQRTRG